LILFDHACNIGPPCRRRCTGARLPQLSCWTVLTCILTGCQQLALTFLVGHPGRLSSSGTSGALAPAQSCERQSALGSKIYPPGTPQNIGRQLRDETYGETPIQWSDGEERAEQRTPVVSGHKASVLKQRNGDIRRKASSARPIEDARMTCWMRWLITVRQRTYPSCFPFVTRLLILVIENRPSWTGWSAGP
jgi:hypothetical protein